MTELKDIKDDVIKKGFPILLGEDICISYAHLDDALMTQGKLDPDGYYIKVDWKLRDAPLDILEGGIAHGLAHIIWNRQSNLEVSLCDLIAYKISLKYKELVEKEADITTVIRGYGHQLLALLKYSEKLGYRYCKDQGLSIGELGVLLNAKKD